MKFIITALKVIILGITLLFSLNAMKRKGDDQLAGNDTKKQRNTYQATTQEQLATVRQMQAQRYHALRNAQQAAAVQQQQQQNINQNNN